MDDFSGGKDSAVGEAKNRLAIIVYQENRFPFAVQALSEGCVCLKKANSSEDVVVLGRKDEAGDKMQDVIDLVSDEEEMDASKLVSVAQDSSSFPLERCPEGACQETRQMPRDFETSEKTEAEGSRKRAYTNRSNYDAAFPAQIWQEGSVPAKKEKLNAKDILQNSSVEKSIEDEVIISRIRENRGCEAVGRKEALNFRQHGDSAGVIPLADADLLDWMAVSQKQGGMVDQTSRKVCNERSLKRTVAVKMTHSSALAKKSTPSKDLAQSEEIKEGSGALASRRINKLKPRMRGELILGDGVAPQSPSLLAFNSQMVDIGDGSSQEATESEERKLVRETLHKFETLRCKLLQDEEARVKESGNGVKRPDLKAGTIMNANNLWLNRSKKIGAISGVDVGDQFYFRVQLCIVGLHRQIQAGIDSISPKDNQWDVPVAASIISSGGYEDDLDNGETLIYTGQGGNNYQGNKKQQQDQKLERGNLALKHSYKLGIPVRVIRGSKCKESPTGTIYTYDGLYKVERFWLERGLSGYGVYKFQLQRLLGQLRTNSAGAGAGARADVRFMGAAAKSKSSSETEAIIHEDISRGKEGLRICVVNSVDTITEAPAAFEYGTSIRVPPGLANRPALEGCQCADGCSDSTVCCCMRRNGGRLPYTRDGAILEMKNMLYECGDQCHCPPTCGNRLTQHGAKHRFEVFKKDGGWGVRSWDSIPSGSFICEYVGQVVVASGNAQKCIEGHHYVLQVDRLKQRVAPGDISMEPAKSYVFEGVESAYVIDARGYGNVARFIDHSSSPNLYAQSVLYDHEDIRIPHVMLFALVNVRPFTELTFDYGKDVHLGFQEGIDSGTKEILAAKLTSSANPIGGLQKRCDAHL